MVFAKPQPSTHKISFLLPNIIQDEQLKTLDDIGTRQVAVTKQLFGRWGWMWGENLLALDFPLSCLWVMLQNKDISVWNLRGSMVLIKNLLPHTNQLNSSQTQAVLGRHTLCITKLKSMYPKDLRWLYVKPSPATLPLWQVQSAFETNCSQLSVRYQYTKNPYQFSNLTVFSRCIFCNTV